MPNGWQVKRTTMKRIQYGDCLSLMQDISPQSVDLLISDFPYGTTNCKWDTPINLNLFWTQANRICKPTTPIVLFAQTPFDKVLGASNLKMLRYEWIWEKSQPTGHLNAKTHPMKAHENVLIFYKRKPVYNPIKTTGHPRKVATAHHKRNCNTGNIYGKSNNFNDYNSTERYPRDVLKFPTDKQTNNLHETQKPVKLIEYFIKTYSNEGDLVLDPCAGSGTTAEACINTNRNYICMDNDLENYTKMFNRIQAIIGKDIFISI